MQVSNYIDRQGTANAPTAEAMPGPSGASTIVLILFIAAGILEFFVPRTGAESNFTRLPIQILSGLSLGIIWTVLLGTRKRWNAVTLSLLAMILMVVAYTIVYLLSGKFELNAYTPYLRMLLWMSSSIFFFEEFLKNKPNILLLKVFVATAIISTGKHIAEESVLLNVGEFSGGGDTAGLTLLFLIPLILVFFNRNTQIFLLISIFVLVMMSLRRTAIFGVLLCIPFIYRVLKSKLATRHMILLAGLSVAVLPYAWMYFGDTLVHRFQELAVGDGGGEKDSYGSGRSVFYPIVFNSWWESGWETITVGLGLGSVREMLTAAYGLGHAHNDFLEIAHTFGLLGLAVWVAFLVSLWRLRFRLRHVDRSSVNFLYLTLISYLVVAATSGCILRISTLPLSISIAAVTAIAVRRKTLT